MELNVYLRGGGTRLAAYLGALRHIEDFWMTEMRLFDQCSSVCRPVRFAGDVIALQADALDHFCPLVNF